MNRINMDGSVYESQKHRVRGIPVHNPMNMENQEALVKIRSLKDSLRPAEREIADIILADPRRLTTMTITDLAQLGTAVKPVPWKR